MNGSARMKQEDKQGAVYECHHDWVFTARTVEQERSNWRRERESGHDADLTGQGKAEVDDPSLEAGGRGSPVQRRRRRRAISLAPRHKARTVAALRLACSSRLLHKQARSNWSLYKIERWGMTQTWRQRTSGPAPAACLVQGAAQYH
jgi:hypothetical protein